MISREKVCTVSNFKKNSNFDAKIDAPGVLIVLLSK